MCYMEKSNSVPILFPYDPEEFWSKIRIIIKEEINRSANTTVLTNSIMETTGLTQKPLIRSVKFVPFLIFHALLYMGG